MSFKVFIVIFLLVKILISFIVPTALFIELSEISPCQVCTLLLKYTPNSDTLGFLCIKLDEMKRILESCSIFNYEEVAFNSEKYVSRDKF